MFPIQLEKSPADSGFFACDRSVKRLYHALLPKTDYRDKGRGHDRRLSLRIQAKQSKYF